MAKLRPGQVNATTFMSRYWQKQPVLLKGMFPASLAPLTPEELAGLALEDDVDARLVFHDAKKDRWRVEHGPFSEAQFLNLPDTLYTLLVQNVDHYVPAVAALRQTVAFLPRWRFDDVMISYATEGGGVGPHIDQYDVFLIQGLGRRRWQVGDKDQPVVANENVKALRQVLPYEASMDVIVEPGDVLYIPPNTPHWGTALEPCMTYSVGFRAPAQTDLLARVAALRMEQCHDGRRYADPDGKPVKDGAEIPPAALEQVRQLLRDAADDPLLVAEAFASLSTQTRQPLERSKPVSEATLRKWWAAGRVLSRVDDARCVWYRDAAGKVRLYANGQPVSVPDAGNKPLGKSLASLLANAEYLDPQEHAELEKDLAFFPLLTTLVNSGVFTA